jgi:hypothetical protein
MARVVVDEKLNVAAGRAANSGPVVTAITKLP